MPNRKALLFISLTALALTIRHASAGVITVKGSDTMVLMSQLWAETYMKTHKGTKITVTGGGSGTGIAAIMNNTVNIANASRPLKPIERMAIQEMGKNVTEVKVAMDALAVVVNQAQTGVKVLTLRQLKAIYTGRVKDWREVGGKPGRIVRYCREANSGTYAFFKEHVLDNEDYAADCQHMAGTAAISAAVSRDPKAIGFGGIGYFAKAKGISVVKVAYSEPKLAINPLKAGGHVDFAKVWSKQYPISRYLYMYKAGILTKEEKAFVDWILSPAGQKVVVASEYVPMPKK